jgi:hypothetical protein
MSHHNVLNTDLYDILCNYNNLRESIILLFGFGVKNRNLIYQVKTLNTIKMKILYFFFIFKINLMNFFIHYNPTPITHRQTLRPPTFELSTPKSSKQTKTIALMILSMNILSREDK